MADKIVFSDETEFELTVQAEPSVHRMTADREWKQLTVNSTVEAVKSGIYRRCDIPIPADYSRRLLNPGRRFVDYTANNYRVPYGR